MTKEISELEKAAKEAALAGSELLKKSHVRSYTRKDGTVVKEHEDSRMSKEEHLAHADRHIQAANAAKGIDISKAKWHKKQAEYHKIMAQIVEKRQEHEDSRQKHDWHSNHQAVARLAAEHTTANQDKETFENAARHMRNKDHEGLKLTLQSADTYQREEIGNHIHPKHWESLGMKAIDHDAAMAKYERKYGKDESAAKENPKSVQTTTRKTPKHNEKAALKAALEQSKQAFSTDKYADHQKALEAHKSAHEKATSSEVKEKHADYIRMHTAESHVAKDKPK